MAGVVLVLAPWGARAGSCSSLADCSGHGICISSNSTCQCYDGWGSETDVSVYKQANCAARVCPADKSWFDVPTAANTAHANAECSDAGLCNRATGKCSCFDGYDGDACQRTECPNDCSGHGKCVKLSTYQTEANALPASSSTTYGGSESTTTWDENKIYGCVCDSTWTVGLTSGTTQEPSWFGIDCSKKHCPSGNDPMTTADETDCENKKYNGATTPGAHPAGGASGNLCQVDCANRGICNYDTGICNCFTGFYGLACTLQSALATEGA